MSTFTTYSEAETMNLGKRLAECLHEGDILLLTGELGAGKSVLARGVARGLGITGPVSSPTFTLLNCYEGRLVLHHFDLYRLEDADEFYAAGLEEALDFPSVSLIEWPQRCPEAMPSCHLSIDIRYGEAEDTRLITLTPCGGFREVLL